MGATAYLDEALVIATRAASTQLDAIRAGADLLATAIANGRQVWAFGTGHSHMIAEELYGRAGGLQDVKAILEPALMLHEGLRKSSLMERLTGLADVLIEDSGLAAGDVLVVVSNSGRNAVPVEAAARAREIGASVLAVTSIAHSRAVASRAPGGQRLFELADVVIDTCGVPGDAIVPIPGQPDVNVGATSTVVGALLVQALVAETVDLLAERGHQPRVFKSLNA